MKKLSKKIIINLHCIVIAAFSLFAGCKKAIQIDPPITGLVSTNVYTNNNTAAAALTSIFERMSENGLSSGPSSLSLSMGLSSDEFKLFYTESGNYSKFYSNNLSSEDKYFWTEIYQQIYVANAAIEGLSASTTLTPVIKQQLMGEAKFMRGFLYFYAVNLYGAVPLVTTTDYRLNSRLGRSSEKDIYNQIIGDLTDAQNLLNDNYLSSTGATSTERVRPNKGAATALLARTYLYTGQWAEAEKYASLVIANTAKYNLLTDLNKVFMKNSAEAIWQLQSVIEGVNTFDALTFILTSPPGSIDFPCALSKDYLSSFDKRDLRYSNWVGLYKDLSSGDEYFYPYKYKSNSYYDPSIPLTEYVMVLRVSEQYLIRAEARIQLGNTSGGITDLNILRARATDLSKPASGQLSQLSTALSKDGAMKAVLNERQFELFSEWGHRWFDLKRTGNLDAQMKLVEPIKNSSWSSFKSLLPIPKDEILLDNNLNQNQGYN